MKIRIGNNMDMYWIEGRIRFTWIILPSYKKTTYTDGSERAFGFLSTEDKKFYTDYEDARKEAQLYIQRFDNNRIRKNAVYSNLW